MRNIEPVTGPRFSLEQIAAFVTATEGSSWGFHVETDIADPQMPEIAELWRHSPSLLLFFVTPLLSGDVEIYDVLRETYRNDTIEAALASIVEPESVSA